MAEVSSAVSNALSHSSQRLTACLQATLFSLLGRRLGSTGFFLVCSVSPFLPIPSSVFNAAPSTLSAAVETPARSRPSAATATHTTVLSPLAAHPVSSATCLTLYTPLTLFPSLFGLVNQTPHHATSSSLLFLWTLPLLPLRADVDRHTRTFLFFVLAILLSLFIPSTLYPAAYAPSIVYPDVSFA
jgi:hypothetical protein